MPKNSSEDFGGRRAEAQRFALPARAGYTVAVAVFVRIVHRAGATAEYNNGSDELLHGTTIIRGPGKVHGGAGGGGSGGRNEGAAVGDSPPFVPVSQSWLHRRCAHRGARGRERRRLLFRPGALFTPEGPVHCQVHQPSSLLPPAGSAAATSEIVLDVGTCEVMNNRQCVIWRYDSPAVDVLDADEAELICAAQIADCLSLPARVVAPPWMRHLGWGRAVSRGGGLRARGHQSSKSVAD